MCLFNSIGRPGPVINQSQGRAAQAAADALTNERRNAQGFSASILGGALPSPSAGSFAREMLLGK